MMANEYLQQNLAGFENDQFAKEKFKELIDKKEIEVLIETGTYLGSTTKLFSEWCPRVITIELLADHYKKAQNALLRCANVQMCLGSSDQVLDNLLSEWGGISDKKIALFLDAHWSAYNPLLQELAVIAKYRVMPEFIAIHDFKVPNHPELGFDTYNGQDYDWDWIKESIESIYGKDGYTVSYNDKATGAMRGIIYIEPNNVS